MKITRAVIFGAIASGIGAGSCSIVNGMMGAVEQNFNNLFGLIPALFFVSWPLCTLGLMWLDSRISDDNATDRLYKLAYVALAAFGVTFASAMILFVGSLVVDGGALRVSRVMHALFYSVFRAFVTSVILFPLTYSVYLATYHSAIGKKGTIGRI